MTAESKTEKMPTKAEEESTSIPTPASSGTSGDNLQSTPQETEAANQDDFSVARDDQKLNSSASESGEAQSGKKSEKNGSSRKYKKSKTPLAKNKAEIAKAAKSLKKSGGRVILTPVDFSEHSAEAMLLGAELAECTDTNLLVLHVVHDPGEMPGYYNKMIKKKRFSRIQDIAEDVFKEFMERVIEDNPKLKQLRKAETLMVMGLPVTRILEVVDKVEPKLVIVGSQGRTGLKHLLLGSKAEQLVHLCPAPITVVKTKKLRV